MLPIITWKCRSGQSSQPAQRETCYSLYSDAVYHEGKYEPKHWSTCVMHLEARECNCGQKVKDSNQHTDWRKSQWGTSSLHLLPPAWLECSWAGLSALSCAAGGLYCTFWVIKDTFNFISSYYLSHDSFMPLRCQAWGSSCVLMKVFVSFFYFYVLIGRARLQLHLWAGASNSLPVYHRTPCLFLLPV